MLQNQIRPIITFRQCFKLSGLKKVTKLREKFSEFFIFRKLCEKFVVCLNLWLDLSILAPSHSLLRSPHNIFYLRALSSLSRALSFCPLHVGGIIFTLITRFKLGQNALRLDQPKAIFFCWWWRHTFPLCLWSS